MTDPSKVSALTGCLSAIVAYIDPGLVSMAFQAVFAVAFGVIVAYMTAPWRWLRGLIRRRRDEPRSTGDDQTPAGNDVLADGEENAL